MRWLALALAVLLVACGGPALTPAAPSDLSTPAIAEPSAAPFIDATPSDTCWNGAASIPPRFRAPEDPTGCPPEPTAVPQPTPPTPPTPMLVVALRAGAFTAAPTPPLKRVPTSEFPAYATSGFGFDLMRFLDRARGVGSYAGAGFDEREWDGRFWPGPFQELAKKVTKAKSATGRFFHFESLRIDAVYSLPWAIALPNMPGATTSGFQFIEVTVNFRDHAETPPAEGELWYTWHLRLPTSQTSVYAIADGYDESRTKTWMNAGVNYWSTSLLENEATSAVAGYLWNESYVPGGNQQFAAARPTTPFWQQRVDGLNHLNELFAAKQLTERRFENMSVRIDRFEPLTFFAGGVVTVTISGRLVEVLNGKTITETFTQPMKFFRFGGSGATISGWTAVDSQEDGVWLSGGNLALDKLETFHG